MGHLVRSAYLQEHWQDVSGQLGVSHISHVAFLGTRHLRGRDFANSVFIRAEDAVGQCKTGKEQIQHVFILGHSYVFTSCYVLREAKDG